MACACLALVLWGLISCTIKIYFTTSEIIYHRASHIQKERGLNSDAGLVLRQWFWGLLCSFSYVIWSNKKRVIILQKYKSCVKKVNSVINLKNRNMKWETSVSHSTFKSYSFQFWTRSAFLIHCHEQFFQHTDVKFLTSLHSHQIMNWWTKKFSLPTAWRRHVELTCTLISCSKCVIPWRTACSSTLPLRCFGWTWRGLWE